MNQILYSGRAKKSPKKIIISIVVVALVAVALLFSFGFGILNLSNDKILSGVIVANIDVSNMTKEEAVEAINSLYSESSNRTLSLKYKDFTVSIDTDEIGFGYTDASELVEKAYAYGRDGNIIQNNFTVLQSYMNKGELRIETEEQIDSTKLENVVREMISGESVFLIDDSYEISGDKLILSKGREGETIDYDSLSKNVVEALKDKQSIVEIPVIISKPNTLDIDSVYSKVHKAPKNASYVKGEDFEIIKEENGLDFDLELAKTTYNNLLPGEKAEIQLTITEPEIKIEDLGDSLFETLIATYTTKYDKSDKNRVTNLEIATNKCNNVILYPEDEFSFNNVVGHRTTANGFKNANSYANGKVVKTVGGGICQISSTLYNTVLRTSGLTITARTAHGMYVEYVPQSTDATVVDNSIDFKFKNSRKYPIKIVMTCANGEVTASIYGLKEDDEPTIEIETKIIETIPYSTEKQNDASMKAGTTKVVQQPLNGYVSESYKITYRNGQLIGRDLISKDKYEPINEIIKVGTKKEVVSVPTPPPEEQKPENKAPDLPAKDVPPGWDNPESGY